MEMVSWPLEHGVRERDGRYVQWARGKLWLCEKLGAWRSEREWNFQERK